MCSLPAIDLAQPALLTGALPPRPQAQRGALAARDADVILLDRTKPERDEVRVDAGFDLSLIGPQADPHEWQVPSLQTLIVTAPLRPEHQHERKRRNYRVCYRDGMMEQSQITDEGVKVGTYYLSYALDGYALSVSAESAQLTTTTLLKEEGTFCAGLPYGNFSVWDENKVLTCWGSYRLILADAGVSLDRATAHATLGLKPPQENLQVTVASDAILVHYEGLSRALNGATQSFYLSPAVTDIVITRAPEETWLEACSRTHAQVLRLVALQGAALLTSESVGYGGELLRQKQETAIMAGCERGGFARLDLGYLPQGADGAYLNGILVSSVMYLEELCQGAEPAPPEMPLPCCVASLDDVLQLPPDLTADLSSYRNAFNWQALNASYLFDDQGGYLGSITYGPLGLMHGPFTFCHEKSSKSEQGQCLMGLMTAHLSYTLYQNFQAQFPAAQLTLDLVSGEFDGPYQVIEDLDELFARGYHRLLLTRSTTHGPSGREVRNVLAPYQPNSFIAEQGTYHQGSAQRDCAPYQGRRPRDSARPRPSAASPRSGGAPQRPRLKPAGRRARR